MTAYQKESEADSETSKIFQKNFYGKFLPHGLMIQSVKSWSFYEKNSLVQPLSMKF